MAESLSKSLSQRRLGVSKKFFIEPDHLRVVTKDTDGQCEAKIEYENITTKTRRQISQDGRLFIAAISFGIFSIVGLIANYLGETSLMRWVPLWVIATPILFAFHFVKRRKYLLLDLANEKAIFFLDNRPSKAELDDFIAAIFMARKEYLRKTYFRIDFQSTPEREMNKLHWLLRNEIITDAEFAQMKDTIEGATVTSQPAETLSVPTGAVH